MRTSLNTTIGCLSLAVVCAGVLVSCQKNIESKSGNSVPATRTTTNLVSLEALLSADDATQLQLSVDPTSVNSSNAEVPICSPTITYPNNPPGVYPYTEVRDWGTGCQNQGSGQVRTGRLITTFFGDMNVVGSYYIQTYDNYSIDGVGIEGKAKVVHIERKSGEPQNVYNQVARNRKLTQPNGDYIIFNSSKRLVKWEDDGQQVVYLRRGYWRMTGITNGDAMEGGVAYQFRDSIDVQNPLIWNRCDYVVRGKEFYDFTNQPSWEVDYGPNVCDNLAELTIDGAGVTTTITLPLQP